MFIPCNGIISGMLMIVKGNLLMVMFTWFMQELRHGEVHGVLENSSFELKQIWSKNKSTKEL